MKFTELPSFVALCKEADLAIAETLPVMERHATLESFLDEIAKEPMFVIKAFTQPEFLVGFMRTVYLIWKIKEARQGNKESSLTE